MFDVIANCPPRLCHRRGNRVRQPAEACRRPRLIKAAARAQGPVVFLEPKALYRNMHAKTLEPGSDYILPFGHGRLDCEGSDATIVTWGATVWMTCGARSSKCCRYPCANRPNTFRVIRDTLSSVNKAATQVMEPTEKTAPSPGSWRTISEPPLSGFTPFASSTVSAGE
jgi:hypothetical protein